MKKAFVDRDAFDGRREIREGGADADVDVDSCSCVGLSFRHRERLMGKAEPLLERTARRERRSEPREQASAEAPAPLVRGADAELAERLAQRVDELGSAFAEHVLSALTQCGARQEHRIADAPRQLRRLAENLAAARELASLCRGPTQRQRDLGPVAVDDRVFIARRQGALEQGSRLFVSELPSCVRGRTTRRANRGYGISEREGGHRVVSEHRQHRLVCRAAFGRFALGVHALVQRDGDGSMQRTTPVAVEIAVDRLADEPVREGPSILASADEDASRRGVL